MIQVLEVSTLAFKCFTEGNLERLYKSFAFNLRVLDHRETGWLFECVGRCPTPPMACTDATKEILCSAMRCLDHVQTALVGSASFLIIKLLPHVSREAKASLPLTKSAVVVLKLIPRLHDAKQMTNCLACMASLLAILDGDAYYTVVSSFEFVVAVRKYLLADDLYLRIGIARVLKDALQVMQSHEALSTYFEHDIHEYIVESIHTKANGSLFASLVPCLNVLASAFPGRFMCSAKFTILRIVQVAKSIPLESPNRLCATEFVCQSLFLMAADLHSASEHFSQKMFHGILNFMLSCLPMLQFIAFPPSPTWIQFLDGTAALLKLSNALRYCAREMRDLIDEVARVSTMHLDGPSRPHEDLEIAESTYMSTLLSFLAEAVSGVTTLSSSKSVCSLFEKILFRLKDAIGTSSAEWELPFFELCITLINVDEAPRTIVANMGHHGLLSLAYDRLKDRDGAICSVIETLFSKMACASLSEHLTPQFFQALPRCQYQTLNKLCGDGCNDEKQAILTVICFMAAIDESVFDPMILKSALDTFLRSPELPPIGPLLLKTAVSILLGCVEITSRNTRGSPLSLETDQILHKFVKQGKIDLQAGPEILRRWYSKSIRREHNLINAQSSIGSALCDQAVLVPLISSSIDAGHASSLVEKLNVLVAQRDASALATLYKALKVIVLESPERGLALIDADVRGGHLIKLFYATLADPEFGLLDIGGDADLDFAISCFESEQDTGSREDVQEWLKLASLSCRMALAVPNLSGSALPSRTEARLSASLRLLHEALHRRWRLPSRQLTSLWGLHLADILRASFYGDNMEIAVISSSILELLACFHAISDGKAINLFDIIPMDDVLARISSSNANFRLGFATLLGTIMSLENHIGQAEENLLRKQGQMAAIMHVVSGSLLKSSQVTSDEHANLRAVYVLFAVMGFVDPASASSTSWVTLAAQMCIAELRSGEVLGRAQLFFLLVASCALPDVRECMVEDPTQAFRSLMLCSKHLDPANMFDCVLLSSLLKLVDEECSFANDCQQIISPFLHRAKLYRTSVSFPLYEELVPGSGAIGQWCSPLPN
eukprot:TRINITY_DN2457_c0_g1_i2.p1 TRINITY_DN2457_c0_g1~~TRINITY_DN2457_c0_g1_i2.p1  ORF type:complete len:1067 (-),score=102.30 TRINITY_DN2457_c0_g1_i2:291-3491(-)